MPSSFQTQLSKFLRRDSTVGEMHRHASEFKILPGCLSFFLSKRVRHQGKTTDTTCSHLSASTLKTTHRPCCSLDPVLAPLVVETLRVSHDHQGHLSGGHSEQEEGQSLSLSPDSSSLCGAAANFLLSRPLTPSSSRRGSG